VKLVCHPGGVPRARKVVLDGAGHFLWVDQPDAFRTEVERFLLQ
jgi:pimeloyl-ACP methyl ester carboxylesterase